MTGYWRKLHSEELGGLYYTQNIIRFISLSMIRWAEPVARMGQKRNSCRTLVGNLSKKYSFFTVYGSAHRKNILLYIQQDATLHIFLFPDTNKLCNVASCWIYSIVEYKKDSLKT